MVDLLLLILPGVIWGASFLFIAEGLEAMAPNGVTFVRIFVGFLTLSMIPAARRPIVRSDRVKTAALVALPHPTPAKLHKSPAAAGRMWVAALRRSRLPSPKTNQPPSVPIPKFVSFCGAIVYELRNRRTLGTL